MKRIIIVVFLLSGFIAYSSSGQKTLRTVENKAFKPGEVLKFRLHYGFISAGTATLEVKPGTESIGGRDCYHIVGTGQTVGAFDWFFKVRDRYETMIDKQAMVPLLFIRRVDEGGFIINENVSFNRYENKASSNGTRNKKDISRSIDSLPDNIQDMVSAFYYARTIDFSNAKEGDVFPIQGLIDNQVVPLNVRFVGHEEVDTKMGTVKCLKFHPMLQQGRVFKDNEDMTVWVSDDKNRLPVRARRLSECVIRAAAIPENRMGPDLSREERQRLLGSLKELALPIVGTLGFEKAEVTSGGVALGEVDPKTLESRLVSGLYFAGEILDLDGLIGGYNFQAAWSTGWLAGEMAAR